MTFSIKNCSQTHVPNEGTVHKAAASCGGALEGVWILRALSQPVD